MRTPASQSEASITSRNAFDPFALVRSPMMRNDVSWAMGCGLYSDDSDGSR